MLPCRVQHATLPQAALDAILRVDEASPEDPRWELLQSSNTRRAYRYRDPASGRAWFVKWGRTFSWRQLRHAVLGRDEATVEYTNAARAAKLGLPVVECALLARPNLAKFSVQTLLAAPYVEDAQSAFAYLGECRRDAAAVRAALEAIGALLGEMHSKGVLHQDFTLRNLLVPEGDVAAIRVVDLYRAQFVESPGAEQCERDLRFALSDLVSLGISPIRCRALCASYAERMPWIAGRYDEMYESGRQFRVYLCGKRFDNAGLSTRRRPAHAYRGHPLHVLEETFLREARSLLDRKVDAKERPAEDGRYLWCMANYLERGGIRAHRVIGYAKTGAGSGHVLLAKEARIESIAKLLGEESGRIEREKLLVEAGEFMRRLHDIGLSIRGMQLDSWRVVDVNPPHLRFVADELSVFERNEDTSAEGRFGWLRKSPRDRFSLRDLGLFMRGYGYGTVDFDLLRQVLKLMEAG